MKEYPNVLTEHETLERALAGASLSRFGDGELRLANGGSAISQVAEIHLRQELKNILHGPSLSLVCIPRQEAGGAKALNWKKYAVEKFVKMYGDNQDYGSSFITRPDNAPSIGNKDFMLKIRGLWAGKDIVLVVGTDYGSLRETDFAEARSFRVVFGPRRDAYANIDEIEQKIIKDPTYRGGPVLMCLGATATCLAERLARKGIQGLDLGHIGRFMHRYLEPQKHAVPSNQESVL